MSINNLTSNKINDYIRQNHFKQNSELVEDIKYLFKITLHTDAVRSRKRRIKKNSKLPVVDKENIKEANSDKMELFKTKRELVQVKTENKNLKEHMAELQSLNTLHEEFKQHLTPANKVTITASATEKSESTAVLLLSDWHYEENISSESVNGLNEFNTYIAGQRITNCFDNAVKLLKSFKKDTVITECVIGLLGDYITNSLHEDSSESNEKRPMEAIVEVYNHIASGIEFMLKELPDMNFTAVCKVGNHSRTTKRVYIATESGNSLEYLLYYFLAEKFKANDRVKFILEKNYLTYLNIYNYTIRFHHGHQVKYNGGVGGITIPVKKAIAQWDKSRRADIDMFGHFHQTVIDKDFICNGSLIGYSPYAVAIKAEYEKPSQTLVLIEKEHGRTIIAPVFLEN